MLSPKTINFSIFLLILFSLSVIEVTACTCAGRTSVKNFQPCYAFWNSDVVFIGTADEISLVRSRDNEKDGYSRMVVKFSVEKAVRGVENETIEIETNPNSASCGYTFNQGEKYFVYANNKSSVKPTVSLCSPTVLLKDASVDLEYLQSVENGEKSGRVFGNVFQTVKKSFKDQGEHLPVSGVKVTLTSVRVKDYTGRKMPKYKKREFQTISNNEGFYFFQSVPVGTYKIKAEFPNNLREIFLREDLTEHFVSIDEEKQRCGGHNFLTTSQGSLEVRVIGHDGGNPPQAYLSLVPVDENGKIYISGAAHIGGWANRENGRFNFNAVPPGKYLLAINPQDCPSREKSEFGKMFYPGVRSELQAEIITIAEYEKKKIADFRLLPLQKERIVSGVVLTADKIPVSGAKVILYSGNLNKCAIMSDLNETKTDEFGRFQIKGYEGYEYKIRAYGDRKSLRLLSSAADIPVTGNPENLELILSNKY